jgi:hypothetical protein
VDETKWGTMPRGWLRTGQGRGVIQVALAAATRVPSAS